METGNADITDTELKSLVQSMMDYAKLANKETINLQDFQQILSDFNDKFHRIFNILENEVMLQCEFIFKKVNDCKILETARANYL